ncbi:MULTISPECIES: hypothetical protein [Acidianus]|uniref:Uncharacterized protein n=1 Tax=Candidatus Acidianus copahuensis TaxID=1160895 RepID=A0A031LTN7_9CREN|nr:MULTISPECIES: hypothetical protein [Acidianus]EZQ11085.1 hypothetical protein CM19_02490 [Candidatus Acidianus copahuensis]NON62440.1 hypothetical protein [Acidianus sp. RZ1]
MLNIPDDVKNSIKEDSCIVCCDSFVLCMTLDFPRNSNAQADLEIDRTSGDIVLRNIIKDNPQNPLYIEYFVSKKFVEKITKEGKIKVIFVDREFNEEMEYTVKLEKEDINIIRREAGLGN